MTLLSAICVACVATSLAQSPVSLTILPIANARVIPDNFSGISLEMGSLKYGNAGTRGNMLDDTTVLPISQHQQILTIFRELGIRNVRVGGGSVDMNIVPSNADIDAFFRFVRTSEVDVIYSVRLLNGNITDDTNTVKYLWGNYRQHITAFAIGNEPDWSSYHNQDPAIKDYPTYLADWRKFAAAITTAVPQATFGGPDTGSNYPVPGAKSTNYIGFSWSELFADDEKTSGIVKSIYLHNYVGQGASGTPQSMIDNMLSTAWVTSYYPALYTACCVPVTQAGFPFRLTESNSFSGYLSGGSNSFATALFSLDYLHWWAGHGAAGVNFHNKQWVGNGPIYMDANQNYQVYPVGYGIKAFDLGGHGLVDSVIIGNSDGLNVTAYAVQSTNTLFVTVINKEHGAGARNAAVRIAPNGFSGTATVVYLRSPNGVTDTTGVTIGGAAITNSGPWQGVWSPIDSASASAYFVSVPASSAAVVRISNLVTAISEPSGPPARYELSQNYPNPFNPTTAISYQLSAVGLVTLKVFDLLGREVATLVDQRQNAGRYTVTFDASALASGIYFYRLEAGSSIQVMKMTLVR